MSGEDLIESCMRNALERAAVLLAWRLNPVKRGLLADYLFLPRELGMDGAHRFLVTMEGSMNIRISRFVLIHFLMTSELRGDRMFGEDNPNTD